MMRRQSVQFSLVGMDLSELIPDNLFFLRPKYGPEAFFSGPYFVNRPNYSST